MTVYIVHKMLRSGSRIRIEK